jgi:hypothetical protein
MASNRRPERTRESPRDDPSFHKNLRRCEKFLGEVGLPGDGLLRGKRRQTSSLGLMPIVPRVEQDASLRAGQRQAAVSSENVFD